MEKKINFFEEEMLLISGLFKIFKRKMKKDLSKEDYTLYCSINEKLKNIKKYKIKGIEFTFMITFLEIIRAEMFGKFPKKEQDFFDGIIKKLNKLKSN